ncbi:MAG: tetratricopeptide repeat protein, partial [Candidatus Eremiobacteraeota bacterium]|nr:tetratricopeptide repeat protein [Candidatus Eremiobacteraeota bacterium]
DLLTVQERALLRRVAIFASGWTLPAAEAVCADGVLPAPELFELHASLVDKSLVVADVGAQTTRYRLLESTRAYGRERLAEAGEYDAVARRLAAWGVEFADGMYEQLWNTPIARWLADVEPERENLRAALTWCLDAGHDGLLGARIAGSLSGLWSLGGLREEGRRAIEDALAQLEPDAHPGVEGRLWRGLAGLSVARRQVEAAQRAIALFEHSMNRAELADTYRQLSTGLFDMDRMQEAEAASRRALELYREAGRSGTRRYAITMQGLAGILLRLGRVDQARETLMAGVWVPENLRDTAAATLMSLGELEFSEGHAALALAHCNEAAAIGAALRDQRIQAAAACNAAGYHLALAQYDEARACGAESLELSARGLDERLCTVAMLHLAAVAAERGDARRGALLLGYTDAWFSKEHCAYEFTEQRSRDAARARLRTALHEETAAALEAYGRALTQAQALAEARAV